jgi:hypothetical protein
MLNGSQELDTKIWKQLSQLCFWLLITLSILSLAKKKMSKKLKKKKEPFSAEVPGVKGQLLPSLSSPESKLISPKNLLNVKVHFQ